MCCSKGLFHARVGLWLAPWLPRINISSHTDLLAAVLSGGRHRAEVTANPSFWQQRLRQPP